MKKAVCLILALIMVLSVCAPVGAVAEVDSFSDVAESHWAHSAIMEMVDIGLFEGMTVPVGGVGTFEPTGTMTRAQFITVITRYLYGGILDNMAAGKLWYSNNYDLAVSAGIITESEMPLAAMKEGISRQEMAMVMVRAAEKQGEYADNMVDSSRIADYDNIDDYYREYVKKCFAMGMIKGYDDVGTFYPHNTVTRAQGAVVLYRLVNADSREPESGGTPVIRGTGTNVKDYTTEGGSILFDQMYADWSANQERITITYGKARYDRLAVAGDTYIKKDGTSIVLKMGPSGVVGEGQGVMADLGLVWGNVKNKDHVVHVNGQWRYDKTFVGDEQCELASDGSRLHGQYYSVNKLTGEGHFGSEWAKIYANEDYLKYIRGIEGEYDGQLSGDPLKLWTWNASIQEWERNA